MRQEFVDIPNYHLASKAFDVRHLDKFLTRVNDSSVESVNNSYQLLGMSHSKPSMQLQQKEGSMTDRGIEEPIDEEEVVMEYGSKTQVKKGNFSQNKNGHSLLKRSSY